MQSYDDHNGRRWTLELTVATVRALRADPGVDLYDSESVRKALRDPLTTMDVLWALCQGQADPAEKDAFYEGMLAGNGETFEEATVALLEELESFFRRSGQRLLASLVRQTLEARPKLEAATERTEQKLEAANLVEKMIQTAEDETDAALANLGAMGSG